MLCSTDMFPRSVLTTRRIHARVRTLQDECLHTFWLTKTCLCVTFNIWHHPFHLTIHICSRNDVPPHDLTYEPFSVSNFWHMKQCLTTLVLLIRLWCVFTVKKRPSAQLFDLHGRVRMQIFSWKDVSLYNLSHNFVCLVSTDMFPRSVDYKTCSCACSHTKRPVSAHFLSYEVISMRNVKHMTPCWSPNFP